jgi:hypothetical protein
MKSTPVLFQKAQPAATPPPDNRKHLEDCHRAHGFGCHCPELDVTTPAHFAAITAEQDKQCLQLSASTPWAWRRKFGINKTT